MLNLVSLSVIMLNVFRLSVVLLNLIMLSVIILNAIMMDVFMPSVIMSSVVASLLHPFKPAPNPPPLVKKEKHYYGMKSSPEPGSPY